MKEKIIFSIFVYIFQWSHLALAAEEAAPKEERKQVAFLKEKCTSGEGKGALGPVAIAAIGFILPKVIEAGLDAGSALIKSSAEQKIDTKSKNTTEFNAAEIDYDGRISTNKKIACLVYFDGTFNEEKNGNFDKFCPPSDDVETCALAGAQSAHVLFEAKLNLSENRRLSSNLKYFQVQEFMVADTFLSRSDARDFIIAIDVLNLESGKNLGGLIFKIDDVKKNSSISNAAFGQNDTQIVLPKEDFAQLIDKQKSKASNVRTQMKLKYPESEEEAIEAVAEKRVQESKIFQSYCAKAPKKIADEECKGGFGEYKRALAKVRAEEIKSEAVRRATKWIDRECKDLTASDEADNSVTECLESQVPSITAGNIYLKITATETKDGSKFWTSVANLISSSKTDFSKTISSELLKDKDKIKAEENETEAKNLQDLEIAKAAVLLAEVKVASLPTEADAFTKASAEFEVKKAKLNANAASRKLGYAKPYPELP